MGKGGKWSDNATTDKFMVLPGLSQRKRTWLSTLIIHKGGDIGYLPSSVPMRYIHRLLVELGRCAWMSVESLEKDKKKGIETLLNGVSDEDFIARCSAWTTSTEVNALKLLLPEVRLVLTRISGQQQLDVSRLKDVSNAVSNAVSPTRILELLAVCCPDKCQLNWRCIEVLKTDKITLQDLQAIPCPPLCDKNGKAATQRRAA